jgi:hypothetical protein
MLAYNTAAAYNACPNKYPVTVTVNVTVALKMLVFHVTMLPMDMIHTDLFLCKNTRRINAHTPILTWICLTNFAGTRVLANVGKGGYKAGVVIKQWDEGNPYRIRLDNGTEV